MSEIIAKDPDTEVIQMVNANTAYRRRLAEEAKNLAVFPHRVTREEMFELRKYQLKRVCAAGIRGGIGLVFIGAMVRGLMDPGFALTVAGACVLWALWTYRRGAYGK